MKIKGFFVSILLSLFYLPSAFCVVLPEPKILTNSMLKVAWSAMDQAYPRNGKTVLSEGSELTSPDNMSKDEAHARKMPWGIANDFIVKFDTGVAREGGRAIIYTDSSMHTILVSLMGTNGNGDTKGWDANMRDMALMQLVK